MVDAEDRPLALAVGNDRQFAALCLELGLPELADDPRFATNPARVAHRAELLAALDGPLRTRPADAWFEALTAVGVPCGPINDLAAAFAFADRLGLDARVQIDDPSRDEKVEQVANPIRLSATPAAYRSAPPRLGEHTGEVLAELGLPRPESATS